MALKLYRHKKIFAAVLAIFFVFLPFAPELSVQAPMAIPAQGGQSIASGIAAATINFPVALKANVVYATTTPAAPSTSAPQTTNFLSCAATGGSLATCLIEGVTVVTVGVVNLLIDLGAYLTQQALLFNDHIFDAPMVQIGFSVALSIANLGFVLGIIIIALATILRNQTYGIKQALWKLIVMAILVNFGLVICAPIVGTADSLSNYFITSIAGTSSDGMFAFTNTLVAGFAPQALLDPQVSQNAQNSNTLYAACNSTAAVATLGLASGLSNNLCAQFAQKLTGTTPSAANSFWTQLMAMIFDIIFASLIAITLFCLAILLLVRYVAISLLMILLPLAWLLWIFPKFKNNFDKWWNEFIRWALFPAVAMFFLYLAFETATATTAGQAYMKNFAIQTNSASQGAAGGLATQLQEVGPIGQAIDEFLLIGITIGGLIAASKLTGKAGDVVVGAAKSTTKAVGNYASKQAKKGARATFRAAGGNDAVKAMREGRIPGKGIPGFGWAATRVGSLAGQAIEPHLTNAAMVEEEKKKLSSNPEELKSNLMGNMNTEKRLAHIAKLTELGELSSDLKVGRDKTVDEFLDSNKAMVQNYGFVKGAKDADKAMGGDADMRAMAKIVDPLEKNARALRDQVEQLKKNHQDSSDAERRLADAESKLKDPKDELDRVTRNFIDKLSPSDISKINVNDVFGKDTALAHALTRGFILYSPQMAAKSLPKMKRKQLSQFEQTYSSEVAGLKANSSYFAAMEALEHEKAMKVAAQKATSDDVTKKALGKDIEGINGKIDNLRKTSSKIDQNIEKADAAFKKSFANQAFFGGSEHGEHGDHDEAGGAGEHH